MGLRSSAHICQRVTSSVVYMMKQSGYLLLNYLDDFAGAEKSEDANVVFDLLGRHLDSCGLEESVEKASSPCTVMTFLGVKFDTSELTISVTTERVEEILLLVKTWLNLLVSRLLTWLRSLPDDKCGHIIPLYIRKDLFWWYHFLKSYNGVSMMALEDWSQPDEILETDATLSGCGEPGTFLIVSDSIAKYVKLENADVYAFRGASIGEITYQLNKNKGSIYEGYKCLVIHCGTNDIHILSIDQFKSAYCNLISTAKLLFPSMVIALSGILPRPVDLRKRVRR
ncbi:Hypothetical predicted protein [Mytilus galloprovincialis]|uniref:Reverse transcriptase domain-containing protein n=1 Tax=Mytilus galloprovincialis TaxID=29158 RepID=A0A8B6EDW0_MYTGA|nr:Hypothetical predicted protein [Mytilus galloprovincialis]